MSVSLSIFISLIAIVIVLSWRLLDERLKHQGTAFERDELAKALRLMCMRCPRCQGFGRIAGIGSWLRCPLCADARASLHNAAKVAPTGEILLP